MWSYSQLFEGDAGDCAIVVWNSDGRVQSLLAVGCVNEEDQRVKSDPA